MNVQYAISFPQAIKKGIRDASDFTDEASQSQGHVYVLEVNPRASRTVPYVSKAIGKPLARIAALVMIGKSLQEQGLNIGLASVPYVSVKEAALPFAKFPGVDPILGPEMHSTGEVMGISENFGQAFAKAQEAISLPLPKPPQKGEVLKVLCSVNDLNKLSLVAIARELYQLGFSLVATSGTQKVLLENHIPAEFVCKIDRGRPNTYDLIVNQEILMVINTPLLERSKRDELYLRRATIEHAIPYFTTMSAAQAAVEGIRSYLMAERPVKTLQEYHSQANAR